MAPFVGVIFLIGLPILSLIYKMINNLEMKIKHESLRTYQDTQTSNILQEEKLNVYRQLDEGIMTIKDKKIDFTNQIAEDILMDQVKHIDRVYTIEELKSSILHRKIFKLHKLNEAA